MLTEYFFILATSIVCVATLAGPAPARADDLEPLFGDLAPETAKWASVCIVTGSADAPKFEWHHYKDSADSVAFWPASTIKIYAVVAALEYLTELDMPLDCTLTYEHQEDGRWVLDASRTMREMISEVFRRSSNEDYTLLLRFVGIDRINTKLLIPERGFDHSALMRGYVLGRPYEYVREEAQRITVRTMDGRSKTVEHTWSGRSYSAERGATIISKETGNCTSTRELAECMRRIIFFEHIPEGDRYHLTDEQLEFLRYGGDGLTGLEHRSNGSFAWRGVQEVFPDARYYYKAGQISTHTLDNAYVDDEASGARFILCVATDTGDPATVTEMAKRIAQWVKDRKEKADSSP